MPAVLKWAVTSDVVPFNESPDGNATCPRDLGSTTCHSRHSTCTNLYSLLRPFGIYNDSYTCRCRDGYQGNPYLPDGCQDIDGCTLPNKCYGHCTNIPGDYICECPQGSSGNARILNGCLVYPQPQASHRPPAHPGLSKIDNFVSLYVLPGLSIGLGVGSFALLLLLFLGTTVLMHKLTSQKKKRQRQRFFKQNRGQLLQQLVAHRTDIAERMIVTLEELEKATKNFDKSRELGNGGHGTVYKGILSSQHVVAIKKSKIMIQREIDHFINEVAILSQINHRNIVKLFGCYLLVYEFISNGTLHSHLHIEEPMSISWKDRLRIVVEIAKAIAYLHSLVSMPIIHRDIKSPNILLDENLNVKLSDFGASRYVPIDQTGVDTTIQGTFGYLNPMYYSTGHLTEKSDVYSFGVVHIELLTRKKPVCHVDRLKVTREGDGEVVDVALLAAICVKFIGTERPTMRQVEMTLEGIYAAKDFDSSEETDDEEDFTQVNDPSVGLIDMEATSLDII
ncbi:putative wall-associated receptor kinase-like 16 [Panicum miliaceum]|uniref:Wall-associated receptor kinase-like 16 n=1 Tax=Panicum miliaceum TaxID=4540 RepID=A0A3L6Q268_PANMI|nr:putative wall-associated receptor kinase-like 16 [Panicum miliaceum]